MKTYFAHNNRIILEIRLIKYLVECCDIIFNHLILINEY